MSKKDIENYVKYLTEATACKLMLFIVIKKLKAWEILDILHLRNLCDIQGIMFTICYTSKDI
jgi:hypothetical protein